MKRAHSLLSALCLFITCGSTFAASPIAAESRQMLLVTTAGWGTVAGTMQRFERSAAGAWSPVGDTTAVVVGRGGLGWGLGLHSELDFLPQPGEPMKQEGDGKAPAGAFRLGSAFGAGAGPTAADGTAGRYPYTQATENLRCVDDVNSIYYNELVDVRELGLADSETPPWTSDESMRRTGDNLYDLGLLVGHNVSPAVMGMGSCIFMHIWRGPDRGTAGCTAMEEPNILATVLWLDRDASPVLVQLPQAQYDVLKAAWELP